MTDGWTPHHDGAVGDLWTAPQGAARVEVAEPVAVARALAWAADRGLQVQVVRGPRAPTPRALQLDVAPLSGLVAVDEISRVAHLRAGTTWAEAEALVAARGLTLGPVPGCVADTPIMASFAQGDRRRPSPAYGHLTDGVLALRAALPTGVLTRSAVAPRRATGPDLARCVVGAGAALGLAVDVHLQVWARPTTTVVAAVRFGGWDAAHDGAAVALGEGLRPAWWCARRRGRAVELLAGLWGDGSEPDAVRRFVEVTGGDEAPPEDAQAWRDARLDPAAAEAWWPQVVAPRGGLAAAAKGRRGVEAWDLRQAGATLYAPGAAAPPFERDAWAASSDRLAHALRAEEA